MSLLARTARALLTTMALGGLTVSSLTLSGLKLGLGGLTLGSLTLGGLTVGGATLSALLGGEAVAADAAPAKALSVVALQVGRGVEARRLVGVGERFAVDGGRLWGHVTLANPGAPTTVTMIWRRNGVERFRTDLAVGTSPSWRTWSRVTPSVKRDAGSWEVEVRDAAGAVLGHTGFEVVAPESADLGAATPEEGEFGC